MGYARAEPLRIGVFLHAPVVMQKTPGGEPYGPGIEYAKAVARALGYEPKIELLPLSRIFPTLQAGGLDISLELGINEKRKAFILYPEKPCFITHQSLTVRAASPVTAIGSVGDVRGMRIGYLLGAYTGTFFARATGVTFDSVAGDSWIAQNLAKLLSYRIDAILDQNEFSCLAEARRQGLEKKIRVIPLPGDSVKGYVIFSRKNPNAPALVRAYNALNGTPALPNENAMIVEYLNSEMKQQ
jgi:ABC-type amino acid transport substrate-binding protein